MIEVDILQYLMTELGSDNVCLEIPKDMPSEFVVFQIVDRSRENLIDAVTVRFWSYAKTKAEAAVLDAKVRGAMQDFDERPNISRSKMDGGRDDYDTSLKRYRYQCYFNITYMEG